MMKHIHIPNGTFIGCTYSCSIYTEYIEEPTVYVFKSEPSNKLYAYPTF